MDKYYDVDNTIICPYNPAHRIEKGTRFQLHLIKCREDYPDVEQVSCPFNFTHRVKKPELRYHLSVCPDADVAKKQLVTVKDDVKYVPPVLSMTCESDSTDPVNDEENWDNELPPHPVEVKRCGKNKNLHFINSDRLSGLKPAEKRRIRQLLSQGETVEDVLDQTIEPEEIKVPSTNLKKMPSPKSDPVAMRKTNTNTDTGVNNKPRILANIFSSPSFAPLTAPVPNTASPIMGRGFGPLVSRPPPGLEKFELKTCGRGIAIQPKTVLNKSNVPPGFGSLYETENRAKIDYTQEDIDSLMGDLNINDFESEAASQVDEAAEREKRSRRIEKKLKQIEHLKNKERNGAQLNDEEMAKVRNEAKFKEELKSLIS